MGLTCFFCETGPLAIRTKEILCVGLADVNQLVNVMWHKQSVNRPFLACDFRQTWAREPD
jgi:hypothetical protein